MKNTDPRIDSYIARAAGFAKPTLRHLRKLVHEACPDAEETMKWSSPTFLYRGRIMAGKGASKDQLQGQLDLPFRCQDRADDACVWRSNC